MADQKTCVKCGKKLRSDNTKGYCGQVAACKARAAGASATPKKQQRRDADDAVLDRVGLEEKSPPAPPVDKAEAHAAIERDETWLAKFYRLHEALGLDAEAAIEEHCREWVEVTTARALGDSMVVTGSPKPKRQRAQSNGASKPLPLDAIGDDYERARAQAEGAPA